MPNQRTHASADPVERSFRDSFPASDPPSWTGIHAGGGAPAREAGSRRAAVPPLSSLDHIRGDPASRAGAPPPAWVPVQLGGSLAGKESRELRSTGSADACVR